jgi:hypothetical protein
MPVKQKIKQYYMSETLETFTSEKPIPESVINTLQNKTDKEIKRVDSLSVYTNAMWGLKAKQKILGLIKDFPDKDMRTMYDRYKRELNEKDLGVEILTVQGKDYIVGY